MRTLLIIAAILTATPAQAASPAQRPSILKYYLCLANPTVIDKTRCHL